MRRLKVLRHSQDGYEKKSIFLRRLNLVKLLDTGYWDDTGDCYSWFEASSSERIFIFLGMPRPLKTVSLYPAECAYAILIW